MRGMLSRLYLIFIPRIIRVENGGSTVRRPLYTGDRGVGVLPSASLLPRVGSRYASRVPAVARDGVDLPDALPVVLPAV